MFIEIREATLEDTESICELNQLEMGYEFSLAKTKEKLCTLLASKKDKIFVAIVDKTVVGYIHANDYDTIYFPHMKNIMGIAVATKYKRQGIGKKLMEAVETWARESDAKGIRLVSGSTRVVAHEFYRHCGFEEGKQQLNFRKFLE